MVLGAAAESKLIRSTAIGPFSWRWPEGVENYERGWAAIAGVDGQELRIRHGIGNRLAFGRSRIRSVTWVEGEVAVEGVEADDFGTSQSLVSLIKVTKKHLQPTDPVPKEYGGFHITVFADEVIGPHSFRSLAVKIRQDDIEAWTRHALLRSAAWGRPDPDAPFMGNVLQKCRSAKVDNAPLIRRSGSLLSRCLSEKWSPSSMLAGD